MARLPVRCALALVLGVAPAGAAELTVVVGGAAPTGTVRAMVFANADAFAAQTHPVAAFAVTPRDGRVRVTVADLPPGPYAIAAYQDINGNQQLDRNWLGVPSEPTAFSRDARPGLTAIGFDEAAVQLLSSGLCTTLRLE